MQQASTPANPDSAKASSPLRIAWLGAIGGGGGVAGIANLFLEALLKAGIEVDIYYGSHDVESVRKIGPGLRVIQTDPRWEWNRWYSRGKLAAFVSSSIARMRAYGRLIDLLVEENRKRPYDVIFQFSQTELLTMKKHLAELPPVVIYPCVHAAGELRWHRKESAYARQSENLLAHYIVRAYLMYRTRFQRRELALPTLVIGMSRRFNELLRQDYGITADRQGFVYNPITPAADQLRGPEAKETGRPIRLLFVARISVRKGVEMIVNLSHRLDDLAGQVEIVLIGGGTLWSDYRGHMKELNPRTARYAGGLPHKELMEAYREGDALILPSHYEPGGIVVGEALSRGLPVVVNEEIGSAEPVQGPGCRRFKAGDMDGFEREVRQLINDLRADPYPLRAAARQQATEHFLPEKVAGQLADLLRQVAAKGRSKH